MFPEPLWISRSIWPLTFNVRSKVPSAAAHAEELATSNNANVEICSFLFMLASRETDGNLTYSKRIREQGTALLQHDLVVFFQAAEQLCLCAVGDATGNVHLALAVFAFGIGDLDRRLLIFVVDDRAFGDDQNVL